MPKRTLKRTPREIDACLARVQGSIQLAAKILDMTPLRLKNAVAYRSELRAKWGKPQRGRPSERLKFRIVPYEPLPETGAVAGLRSPRVLELLQELSPAEVVVALENFLTTKHNNTMTEKQQTTNASNGDGRPE